MSRGIQAVILVCGLLAVIAISVLVVSVATGGGDNSHHSKSYRVDADFANRVNEACSKNYGKHYSFMDFSSTDENMNPLPEGTVKVECIGDKQEQYTLKYIVIAR
jgi:hypothetical protein